MTWAMRYARLALAAAFLSAVASRFGLWPHGSWASFERYNAQVNAFLPAVLLALFAVAMAISFGVKEPLDYSVFSASAAAALLSVTAPASRAASPPPRP